MRRHGLAWLGAGLALLLSALTPAPAVSGSSALPGEKTLQECYAAALKRSETIGQSQELILQAEDNYKIAIGSVLPNISGSGSYQWQQNNVASGAVNIFPNPSTNTKLTVTQPIFQGFKEFAGLKGTKDLIHASQCDRQQAAVQLYEDTAASYFAVVSYEHDLDNITEELGYYDSRITELSKFRKIGRSQVTDVLTAQAQQSNLRAQLKQIRGQLRAQRAVLAFLTGFEADVPLARPSAEKVRSRELSDYLARVDSRPDVKGDMERAKASDENIAVARAGHYPTLGVTGDYYLERTGALRDVTWDVMLTLNVPIFSGGAVSAEVEQAVSKRDQADLQVSRTRRLAEQQIRQFYESYVGDREQFEGFREASELAEKNYKEETREFRLGLVTNLDVLTALTTFQESKRSFDKARYAMLQDVEDLEAASGFKEETKNSK